MSKKKFVSKLVILGMIVGAIIPKNTAQAASAHKSPPKMSTADSDFNNMIFQPGYDPAGYNYPMGTNTPVESDNGANGTSEPMEVVYTESENIPPTGTTTDAGWQWKGEDSIVESDTQAERTGKNMYSYGGSVKFDFYNMTPHNVGYIEVWEDDGDGQTNDDYHGDIYVGAGSNGSYQGYDIYVDSWAESESDGRAEIYLEFKSEDINGDWWTYSMYD